LSFDLLLAPGLDRWAIIGFRWVKDVVQKEKNQVK
jgi:hypothetical protein